MKYIITGSIGHISKPLSKALIDAGHELTIITSSAAKADEIKALGATPAVGSIEDRDFLNRTFAGADAAYLMIPPNWNPTNWLGWQKQIADNYVAAVKANNIKHLLVLSSVGAHMGTGCGPVDGIAYLEQQLAPLTEINIKFLRAGYFFYNLYSQTDMIKHAGFVGSTQPSDFRMVLTHTDDIAAAAAAHLVKPTFTGHSVQYVGSDDTHTWADITKALGAAIGKPELPYVELSDEQSYEGMVQAGLSPATANGYKAMGQALRSGDMLADYWQHKPATPGTLTVEEFAYQFATAYNAA